MGVSATGKRGRDKRGGCAVLSLRITFPPHPSPPYPSHARSPCYHWPRALPPCPRWPRCPRSVGAGAPSPTPPPAAHPDGPRQGGVSSPTHLPSGPDSPPRRGSCPLPSPRPATHPGGRTAPNTATLSRHYGNCPPQPRVWGCLCALDTARYCQRGTGGAVRGGWRGVWPRRGPCRWGGGGEVDARCGCAAAAMRAVG